jgi:hypothetical protein
MLVLDETSVDESEAALEILVEVVSTASEAPVEVLEVDASESVDLASEDVVLVGEEELSLEVSGAAGAASSPMHEVSVPGLIFTLSENSS